jgi:hypothetical protein
VEHRCCTADLCPSIRAPPTPRPGSIARLDRQARDPVAVDWAAPPED